MGLYRGYIGIMERKMETTIWGVEFKSFIPAIIMVMGVASVLIISNDSSA